MLVSRLGIQLTHQVSEKSMHELPDLTNMQDGLPIGANHLYRYLHGSLMCSYHGIPLVYVHDCWQFV